MGGGGRGPATVSSFLDSGSASPTRPRRRYGRRSSPGSRGATASWTVEPRERFRDAVRDLVRPALGRLGWEARPGGLRPRSRASRRSDPHARDPRRRPRDAGHGARGRGAVARRRRWRADASVAAAAVEIVAFAGGQEEYRGVRARMQDAPTPQEQDRYRYALARFRDPASDGADCSRWRVRGDPLPGRAVPAGACRGEPRCRGDRVALRPRPLGRAVAALRGLQRDPPGAGRALAHRTRIRSADVQAFFAEHDIPQNRLSLLQAMERQRLLAALRERAAGELAARFGAEAWPSGSRGPDRLHILTGAPGSGKTAILEGLGGSVHTVGARAGGHRRAACHRRRRHLRSGSGAVRGAAAATIDRQASRRSALDGSSCAVRPRGARLRRVRGRVGRRSRRERRRRPAIPVSRQR